MSKRLSGQKNTLFNYFRSPNDPSKVNIPGSSPTVSELNLQKDKSEESTPTSQGSDEISQGRKKRSRIAIIDSDSDETLSSPINRRGMSVVTRTDEDKTGTPKSTKKRSRIAVASSESDEDTFGTSGTKPSGKNLAKQSKVDKRSGTEDTSGNKDSFKAALKSYSFKKSGDSNKEKIDEKLTGASTSKDRTSSQKTDVATTDGNWTHNNIDFLKPMHIRDLKKNRPDHPDYDKCTLFVPEEFLKNQTPAMRQWWILKSKHFDTVLFFKVGKFYELYHMDAVIGVNYLGFSYMKGAFAHSGFPESAYGRMASSLVEQGFKVARVEQTETPEMMTERCKSLRKPGKHDKVVAREICQITTKATCLYGAQWTGAKEALPCYMLAVAEKPLSNGSRFGVCFVDTSIGIFHVGEFDDDRHCSRMLALFAQHPPGLILTERSCMQASTIDLFKKALGDIRRDTLATNSQFYNAQNTLDQLSSGSYFRDKENVFQWPAVLQDLMEEGCPKKGYELALKALGACTWYLKDSELDMYVLSMKKFQIYIPVDTVVDKDSFKRDFMVLDSTTMQNLSLLGSVGTLQKTLDHCETAFGKRLLQQWICRPLCVENRILERQKAVEELYQNAELLQAARAVLKKLPDLERQVAKIHTFGNKFCATHHPDSRAVLYEAKTYSKRKVLDLVGTLNGFQKAQELVQIFQNCESRLLRKLTQQPPSGKFLDLSKTLLFFKKAFDQKQAETEGKIIPQTGVDSDYDDSENKIREVEKELQDYLQAQQKLFACKVSYFGTDKKRFQLEIPDSKTSKVTKEYQLEGTKKGSKRYSTPTTRRFLVEMIKAEANRNKIVQDLNRRIFEKFSDRREEWEQCIQCLMVLDVICSFAEYARNGSCNICFPKILPFQEEPFINIVDGVHPCTLLEDFVPNSTKLGRENVGKLMLLTGPNMGGKSTLMRQVALIVVMAQMGCSVPATNCEISVVDRIFTRLGAHDDILHGQSTFLVELSEASAILQHATRHSFVLLDELGRGTSTHDGNAIATAYVFKIVEIQCRTIFSTHYHTLVDQFTKKDGIQLGHMACMTDDDQDVEDDKLKSVTLLYQLRVGNCPKSYGFNAAKLAGMPKTVIHRGYEVANDFERIKKIRKFIRNLMLCVNPAIVRSILSNVK